MPDQILNWGILGTGFIAHQFARGLSSCHSGRLTAVASRNENSARAFIRECGAESPAVKAYGNYNDMLEDPSVQAVYISTPHPFHVEWSINALRAGKHVMCEKPMAMNAVQAKNVMDEAEKQGLFFMEAYMYRCHPQMAELVKLLRAKVIGEVRFIRSSFSFHSPRPLNTTSRLTNRALGGGGILDVGGYCTSVCGLIAGVVRGQTYAEPCELLSIGKVGRESHVDEYASAMLRYEDDLMASIQCGVQLEMDNTLSVYGADGRIMIRNPWVPGPEDGHIAVLKYDSDDPVIMTPCADRSLYALEIDAFTDALATDHKQPFFPAMSHADSIANMRVMDRWRASIGMRYEGE